MRSRIPHKLSTHGCRWEGRESRCSQNTRIIVFVVQRVDEVGGLCFGKIWLAENENESFEKKARTVAPLLTVTNVVESYLLNELLLLGSFGFLGVLLADKLVLGTSGGCVCSFPSRSLGVGAVSGSWNCATSTSRNSANNTTCGWRRQDITRFWSKCFLVFKELLATWRQQVENERLLCLLEKIQNIRFLGPFLSFFLCVHSNQPSRHHWGVAFHGT